LDIYPSPGPQWAPRNLTDGFTGERRLVEWPEWLRGLSRRREALLELAGAEQEAAQTREAAVERLRLAGLTVALAGALGALAFVRRVGRTRERDLERLRRRIASDLHDEIGSNLGSIALLSELGLRRAGGVTQADLAEIHRVARQTADSMRDIVGLIQRPAVTGDEFLARLREVSGRMLAGLESTFEVRTRFELPSLTAQRHLLLTFKEALHNIRKHANARRVDIVIARSGPQLQVSIADDGGGFDPAAVSGGHGLASLRHRAAALGGELAVVSRPGAGTTLTLTIDPRQLAASHFP
jgi:signal transduction histidine kinase